MSRWLPSRHRNAAYVVGALLAVAAIVWAESEMWKQVGLLRRRAEALSSESFHLSDLFEARMRALNDDVLRYSLQASTERRLAIESETAALIQWLAKNRASAAFPQRELLAKAEEFLGRYSQHAAAVLRTEALAGDLTSWRREDEALLSEFLTLAAAIGREEKLGLTEFMKETRFSAAELQRKLVVSSLIILVMGAAIGLFAYRGVVVPLRSRLRQSQRVIERQEKLSSLGVLAAGVAHEIRNPLTSIKARLFTQQALLSGQDEALEDNAFITEEISRLEKIVADFLAFARPSEPQCIQQKVTRFLREVVELLQPGLTVKNIRLGTEFLSDPQICADAGQMKQVLINLIQNAAESIGRDGDILIRTRLRPRQVSARQEPMVFIEVQDSGQGVPAEVQSRLFDPFFTTKPSGTGLGLSIAARIMEKHGGTLEYEGLPSGGALFRLALPIAINEESRPKTRE